MDRTKLTVKIGDDETWCAGEMLVPSFRRQAGDMFDAVVEIPSFYYLSVLTENHPILWVRTRQRIDVSLSDSDCLNLIDHEVDPTRQFINATARIRVGLAALDPPYGLHRRLLVFPIRRNRLQQHV
ncbi:MAG: hypothetical protein C0483_15055 [Pirellula sp.]|nr:hypothetical protein [Pirellula sp.]